ncbi:hypothetical protein [Aquimarina pacifica]|uniref:hypothetical protein n=1 Tax=Aquimarina pacifica TaxID=1296415 RepID=UPI000470BC8C|nr:hypothetical protein [Aquimarina pacifica]
MKYPILGLFFGLLFGVFTGSIFDSFYTKRSEWPEKQKIQIFIFGAIGGITGLIIGSKIEDEELERKKKEKEYLISLKKGNCQKCADIFEFSTLEFVHKEYCDFCIKEIGVNYVSKLKEITNLFDGIDKLKRKSAIVKRLDKIESIAKEMAVYDDINLDFITKKSYEILEIRSSYKNELIK